MPHYIAFIERRNRSCRYGVSFPDLPWLHHPRGDDARRSSAQRFGSADLYRRGLDHRDGATGLPPPRTIDQLRRTLKSPITPSTR